VSLGERIDAMVIGASAGGIQALSVLLPALPADLAFPVFIVLHLPRDRSSVLAEIFGRKCALPVREAEDKDNVAPGTVYFAPNNYHLLIDAGEGGAMLSLSADDPVHHSRPSIDVLFESAALFYRSRLLGMILTGANEDGAQGLAEVHHAGGLTVVQSPETAVSPLMSQAAIKLHQPDWVLPLEEIAALLRTAGPAAQRRTG
jgi:two-component system chemotaxis response regulator CheB